MSSITDSKSGLQAAAGSSTIFNLKGGKYGVACFATGTGTQGLQRLGPDGTTWIAVYTALAVVSGYTVIDLPPGQYRYTTATFTNAYWEVALIPS